MPEERKRMKEYWLALCSINGIGGATAKKLVERFGSPKAVFDAPDHELLKVARISRTIIDQIKTVSLADIKAEIESYAQSGIRMITLDDPDYPAMLRIARDGPALLFVKGELARGDENGVAVIGTRHPASAAVGTAETIARELAVRDLTIISGLAIGIDTAAHLRALLTKTGRTWAVLGNGLNFVHPRQNKQLAEEIAARGALISDLPPNTPPKGQYLMARDRIISGLSKA